MMEFKKCYTGVGARIVSISERKIITQLSQNLAEQNFVLYGGNTKGADSYFQLGSGGKCVLFMPYCNFNYPNSVFDMETSLDFIIAGNTPIGNFWINKVYPTANKIKNNNARRYLNSNAHQVVGWRAGWKNEWPCVNFVLCCDDTNDNGEIIGNSKHICRIANYKHIPIFNIREQLKNVSSIYDVINSFNNFMYKTKYYH